MLINKMSSDRDRCYYMYMGNMNILKKEIKELSNPVRAKGSMAFFKTDKGSYGEGDVFAGLTVPQSRSLAKKHKDLTLDDVKKLLESPIHEERLIGLLILVEQFQKGTPDKQKSIFEFYLQMKSHVNNWDLVDLSADKIMGAYLIDKPKDSIYKLALSTNLWDKRIAMLTTFWFLKHNQFEDTQKIAKILLHDKHDLIHKAVGWMLREMGKRDSKTLENFLKKHYKTMPRTTLRYAIERFSPALRQAYLQGTAA